MRPELLECQEVWNQGIGGVPSRDWSVLEKKWTVVYHQTLTL